MLLFAGMQLPAHCAPEKSQKKVALMSKKKSQRMKMSVENLLRLISMGPKDPDWGVKLRGGPLKLAHSLREPWWQVDVSCSSWLACVKRSCLGRTRREQPGCLRRIGSPRSRHYISFADGPCDCGVAAQVALAHSNVPESPT